MQIGTTRDFLSVRPSLNTWSEAENLNSSNQLAQTLNRLHLAYIEQNQVKKQVLSGASLSTY